MSGIDNPIHLDANILIYALETAGEEGALARSWMEAIDHGRLYGVTSELTLVEVLPDPISKGDRQLAQAYRDVLSSSPFLRALPVTLSTLLRAADLRASLGCATPDAIHVATAEQARCQRFLTNDVRLKLPTTLLRAELHDVSVIDP